MAVGRIIEAHQAEKILNEDSADLIGIGRELMYNPFWTLHAAEQLKSEDVLEGWPDQYRWAITRRADLEQGAKNQR
jgi:2,4-dienoyl-CoA reductase-like NADH-dependent reductase (Old Yellow Enzyme family)